jgi:sporulation-control protein
VVFKRMLGALGVGGPSVDTVLSQPGVHPGGMLTGQVNVVGGSTGVEIEHITLSLVTRMEVEGSGDGYGGTGEFHRIAVSGPLHLAAGQPIALPFELSVPWEAPITTAYATQLPGMVMGVRTEVAIARAVDKGDLEPVQIHPLPVQQRILDAFTQLGFVFRAAGLEYGQVLGVHQALPFYQEIEYFPAQRYAHSISQLELTFVANPHGAEVILEFDKRGGMFSGGHDITGRHTVTHTDADTLDWPEIVDSWIRQAVENHGVPIHPGYPAPERASEEID